MTLPAAALELIDAFARARMAADGTPGLALALTDRERTLAVRTYGVASAATGAPVTPDLLFEIGSIGKTFTAVALMQEAEAGRLDPRRPLRDYLPWLEIPSAFAPITPHHLLCHTAGITSGPDFTPEARYQVWALRELGAAAAPGERFHYSNLGYKALGVLLETLSGRPYPALIRERVMAPLGMAASEPELTAAIRPRMAAGHVPLHDDRPWHPARPLVPATWLESATADGSVASTPEDMAAFARMLLGRGAPLLGERGFGLLTAPGHRFDDDNAYCYGINSQRLEGRTRLWHGGSMPGFAAHLRVDLDDGLGAVTLMNGAGSPGAVATFALAALRAALRGEPPPELPAPRDRARVEGAAAYAGRYALRSGPDGGPQELALAAAGERLLLEHGGARVALEPHGPDRFFVPHPELDGYLLGFGRAADGRVAEAWHGPRWYAGAAYAGPDTFAHPPEWAAYAGRYRSHSPWLPSAEVALRKGGLVLIWTSEYEGAGDDEEPLVPLPDGSFRIGADPAGPERARFDALVDGQALQLTVSGSPLYRR